MAAQNAVVALTDGRWFEFLRSLAADGRLDGVGPRVWTGVYTRRPLVSLRASASQQTAMPSIEPD